MSTPSTLRFFIACEIALVVLTLAADAATQGSLPAPLQSYITARDANELTGADAAVGLLGMAVLVLVFVAWIGLWRLWRPARTVYGVALVVGFGVTSIAGPVVWSGLAGMFDDLASVCSGVVLGLIFFSPLREKFDARAAAQ